MSAAWVLPGLLGPADRGRGHGASGVALGVLGPAPARGAGGLLVRPALRSPQSAPASRATTIATPAGARTWPAVRLAVGVALVQWAGQQLRWLSVVPAVTGVLLAGPALGRLLPFGTPRLRPGLPAAIGFRDLLAGTFFGAEAFLPLTLSTTHGLSPTLAGLPLTFGALGWFVGSWVQGHWGQRSRYPLVRAGLVLVAVGVGSAASRCSPYRVGRRRWRCSTGWWPAPGWWWRWGRSPCSCWSCPLSPSKGELGRAADHRRGRQHGLYRCRRRGVGRRRRQDSRCGRGGYRCHRGRRPGRSRYDGGAGRPRPGCGRRLGRSGRRPGSRPAAGVAADHLADPAGMPG